MSKRIKIKKQVYYILIGIILIIGVSIFGNYKYKEYKYHQTYEYKLLNHGYNNEDVTKILNNFSEKDYNYFLNNDVNENYIKLLDEKYFLKKNFYKYIEYINKNKKQYPYLTLMCEILQSSISGRWITLDDSQQE